MPNEYGRKPSNTNIASITYWRKFTQHRVIYIILAGVIGLGIVVMFGSFSGRNPNGDARVENSRNEIVSVNGLSVTHAQFDRQWKQMGLDAQTNGDALRKSLFSGVLLERLVQQTLVAKIAKDQGVKPDETAVNKAVEQAKKMRPDSDEETIAMQLGYASAADWREDLGNTQLPEALGAKLAPAGQVQESDLEKTYQQAKLRHILIAIAGTERAPANALPEDQAKRRAEEILAKIKAGGDFAQLANQYSMDPGNVDTKPGKHGGAKNGGFLGSNAPGGWSTYSEFVPEFSQAAFALKPGDVSDIVRTPFGFHIIKMDELNPKPNLPKDFDKNKADLLKQLRDRRAGEAISKLLAVETPKAKLVWKDESMQIRYNLAKDAGQMALYAGQFDPKTLDSLEPKVRAYLDTAKGKEDTDMAFVLAKMLDQKQMMRSFLVRGKAGAAPNPQDDTAARADLIKYYAIGLKSSADTQSRLRLASLYRENKDNDKALDLYKRIQKSLKWDNTPETIPVHAQLESAFRELSQPELMAEEQTKIAKLNEIDQKQKAEQALKQAQEQAKRKAAKDDKSVNMGAALKTDETTKKPAAEGQPQKPANQ